MIGLDRMTTKDRVASSVPFFAPAGDSVNWAKDLSFELNDDQEEELNSLLTDLMTQTLIRTVQFITDAAKNGDKRIVARLIVLEKMLDNKHGNWLKLASQHNIHVRTVRKERAVVEQELGIKIK